MFTGKSKYIIRPIKTTTYHKIIHYNLTIWWEKKTFTVNMYIKKHILTSFPEASKAGHKFPQNKSATQYSLPAFEEAHLNFRHTLSQSPSQWPKFHTKNIKVLTVVKGKGRQNKPTPPINKSQKFQELVSGHDNTSNRTLTALGFFSPSFSFIVPNKEPIQWRVYGMWGFRVRSWQKRDKVKSSLCQCQSCIIRFFLDDTGARQTIFCVCSQE